MKLFQIELECVINVETFTTLSVISLTLLLCPERKKFLVKLHSHLQQQSLTFDTNDLTEVGHFSGCLVVDSLPSPQTTQTEDQKMMNFTTTTWSDAYLLLLRLVFENLY